MRTNNDGRGLHSGGGGDWDGRLRIAALDNDRAAVRVLGSDSLRADAVGRRRASSRVRSISVQNEGALGGNPMGRLVRVPVALHYHNTQVEKTFETTATFAKAQ